MWWISDSDQEEIIFVAGIIIGFSYEMMRAAWPWLPELPDVSFE